MHHACKQKILGQFSILFNDAGECFEMQLLWHL